MEAPLLDMMQDAIGLGAVWTSVYPYPERMDAVRPLLNIPDDVIPLNIIPIGYPTGEDRPQAKFRPDRVHRQKW